MVLAKNISYVYIMYYLAMIGKDFLIPIRSHYPWRNGRDVEREDHKLLIRRGTRIRSESIGGNN